MTCRAALRMSSRDVSGGRPLRPRDVGGEADTGSILRAGVPLLDRPVARRVARRPVSGYFQNMFENTPPQSLPTARRTPRGALAAIAAGIALTVAAVAVVAVDHARGGLLAEHIRAGYPSYSQARIDAA